MTDFEFFEWWDSLPPLDPSEDLPYSDDRYESWVRSFGADL